MSEELWQRRLDRERQARKTAEERVKADRVRAEKREADSLIS